MAIEKNILRHKNTNNNILGEIVSLLLASKIHRCYLLEDVIRYFIIPLEYGQLRIYRRLGRVVGLISWAFLTDEIEQKYFKGEVGIDIYDWKAGNNLWFIDFIAPFGDLKLISQDLRENIFPNDCAKSLYFSANSDSRRIRKFYGSNYQKVRMNKI
jgi:cytolysin-activating lysine-acyltransferase